MLTTPLLIIWIPVNLWGYKQLKCLHLVWRGEPRQKPVMGPPPFSFLPFLQDNVALDCGIICLNTFNALFFNTYSTFKIHLRPPAPFSLNRLSSKRPNFAGSRFSNETRCFSRVFIHSISLGFVLLVRQNGQSEDVTFLSLSQTSIYSLVSICL